jgi:hypothetical protein
MYDTLDALSPVRYLVLSMVLCSFHKSSACVPERTAFVARIMKDDDEQCSRRVVACLSQVTGVAQEGRQKRCAAFIRRAFELIPSSFMSSAQVVYCLTAPEWPVREEHVFVRGEVAETLENLEALRGIENRLDNRARLNAMVSELLGDSFQKVTERVVNNLRVGGVKCDHCLAPRSHADLSSCGRCRRAWYCSRTCQKAAWSTHKVLCHAPEDFKPGDYVWLAGLVSAPQYNYAVGRLVEKTPTGRWCVRKLLDGVTISVKPENVMGPFV